MSLFEDSLKSVVFEDKEVYVPCASPTQQESTRVMFYHLKKKMVSKHLHETIGISKAEVNGKLFVKLYKRPIGEVFEMRNGELVPLKFASIDPEIERMKNLMRKDGMSEEDIEAFFKENTEK